MGNALYKNLFGLVVLVLFLSPALNAAGPSAVNLGSAGNFVILSKTGISTTGTTSIAGDIGVSPAAASYITGFGLIADSSNQFATSSLLNGKAYAANYAPPTPAKMTTAVSDMQTAYTDAAGRTNPTATELGAGNIGGMTIAPGLYKWSSGVTIPISVTLSGGPNDVWIFQIAQTLNVGNGAIITLSGGAQAQNIFWQVAGQATLGTTSDFKGIILSQTAIVIDTGAKLNGRALAQTAVTLDADAVAAPTESATPAPTPTPTVPTPPKPTQTPTSAGTTPTPTPAPLPTTAQSAATSASSNPIIIPSPASQLPVSASDSQIAQNIALGLPAGTRSASPTSAGTTPTPIPSVTPAPKPLPATQQPAPAPASAGLATASTSSAAPRPTPTPAATPPPATASGESAATISSQGYIGSAIQSFISWAGSLFGGPSK